MAPFQQIFLDVIIESPSLISLYKYIHSEGEGCFFFHIVFYFFYSHPNCNQSWNAVHSFPWYYGISFSKDIAFRGVLQTETSNLYMKFNAKLE